MSIVPVTSVVPSKHKEKAILAPQVFSLTNNARLKNPVKTKWDGLKPCIPIAAMAAEFVSDSTRFIVITPPHRFDRELQQLTLSRGSPLQPSCS